MTEFIAVILFLITFFAGAALGMKLTPIKIIKDDGTICAQLY